jgi:hypothetical protein
MPTRSCFEEGSPVPILVDADSKRMVLFNSLISSRQQNHQQQQKIRLSSRASALERQILVGMVPRGMVLLITSLSISLSVLILLKIARVVV